MDFEKAYKNYKNGVATEDEKAYVESEIEKARILNDIIDTIDAKKAIAPSNIDDVKKAKKKHNLNSIIKMSAIAFVSIIVIAGIACAWIFGKSISSAKANTVIDYIEAKEIAEDFIKDNYDIANPLIVEIERELEIHSKLKHSYYNYYVEIELSDGREIDIIINGKTKVASLDYIDD